jgi:hypothetical protein
LAQERTEKEMKKLIVTLVLTITAASFAATNTVSSANIVGYSQLTIPSNQFMMVSLDFNNGSNTINNLFGSFPIGSKVYLWDTTSQAYNTYSKSPAGWGTAGTNQIEVGSGAFLKLPDNVQTNVVFSGDVPLEETNSIYKVNGFAMLSYPYPTDMAFTNTALAKGASIGDKISVWTNNSWETYSRSPGGWTTATGLVIRVGQSFFYQSSTNVTVHEVKPYTID